MLGVILGDIAGSRYEFANNRVAPRTLWTSKDFFTDDTALMLATLSALDAFKRGEVSKAEFSKYYVYKLREMIDRFPRLTYGAGFSMWILQYPSTAEGDVPYSEWRKLVIDVSHNPSFGNGAPMKVAPAAYVAQSLEEAKRLSRMVTEVTHDSDAGIKAAEAVTVAIFTALQTHSKAKVKEAVWEYYSDIAGMYFAKLHTEYKYSELAAETVPAAIVCVLESTDFPDAIRKAVSIGGDADTLAAIAGAVAEALYGYASTIEQNLYDGSCFANTLNSLSRFTEGVFRHEFSVLYGYASPRLITQP